MARTRGEFTHISPCLKWTVFIFNFLFWLLGLLIVCIGLYGMVFTAQDLNGKKSLEVAYIVVTDVSGILVAIGGVIFMVSFAGCVGALRENLCLLKVYFWSLTIFLIAELLVAIACMIFPWKSREILEMVLSERMIELYRESDNTKDLVDLIHMKVECCGMTSNGFMDWNKNEYFNCSKENPSAERCGVPPSCCIHFKVDHNLMCGYGIQEKKPHEASEFIYTQGCITAIIERLESNLYVAAGVIFGITLFQMYVTHQAQCLIQQISRQRSRW